MTKAVASPAARKAKPKQATTVQLHPLAANILVTLEPEAERSAVVHVVTAREDTVRSGRVDAVGPEVTRVEAGVRVWVSTLAGTVVSDGGATGHPRLLLPETSVLAVLGEDD